MYLTLQSLPSFWYAVSIAAFMNLPIAGSRLFLFLIRNARKPHKKKKKRASFYRNRLVSARVSQQQRNPNRSNEPKTTEQHWARIKRRRSGKGLLDVTPHVVVPGVAPKNHSYHAYGSRRSKTDTTCLPVSLLKLHPPAGVLDRALP